MSHTFTQLCYHVVFSTKNRRHLIREDIEESVWRYLGGIAQSNGMTAYQIGGIEDHIHGIIDVQPTISVSKAVQLLKGGSSRWISQAFPELKDFGWQAGYAAFTISKSKLPSAIRYVENQRKHHRNKSLDDELQALIEKHTSPAMRYVPKRNCRKATSARSPSFQRWDHEDAERRMHDERTLIHSRRR